MIILRVQYTVPDYDIWKHSFDADVSEHRGEGLRRYTVYRSCYDPNWVMVDFSFDDIAAAEAMQEKLARTWAGAGRDLVHNPESWIVEDVEDGTVE